jgi:DNA modification methylase
MAPARNLTQVSPSKLKPDPRNPRKHTKAQIEALARSVTSFGFNAPILVHRGVVVAGHARLEAAMLLGLKTVPVITLDDLTDAQVQGYMIADNQLTDRSAWDDDALGRMLKELSDMALDFAIEDIGFDVPEIDARLRAFEAIVDGSDEADTFEETRGPAVSRVGDLYLLGDHRLACDDARSESALKRLMGGLKASAVFTDQPFNVAVNGHVSTRGKHAEFPMASGEMSKEEFTEFLRSTIALMAASTRAGAILYLCMDFRHMEELQAAARGVGLTLVNLCVWVKTNAGLGSFYRGRHELVFVYRHGPESHMNNIQLGRFGRHRTNVWEYAGANIRRPKGVENPLDFHATAKPIEMVADAIRDCTKRGDVILDSFLGSGTTLLAAERTKRRAFGIELDPKHVDTTIERWERLTGQQARHESGATFAELKAARRAKS